MNLLERICEGKGEENDLLRLRNLGEVIKDTSLCGLGQSSPKPGAVHNGKFSGGIYVSCGG